ncbi:DMT family transporter [Thermosynechococcus sp. CL-1]|nr:DMT family transporter [Thermosynechococcus sp. CL-1]QEQ00297.1 DMT family transporter [Thermosynechococcus sp. CL-1]
MTALWQRLILISPFFFWGTAMVAMKEVMPHTSPLWVAGVRLVPAGLLVLAVAIALGKPQPNSLRAWGWISLFALVDGFLFQGFLATGLAKTGAGLGSVMIDSQPLAVALLSRWLYQERVGGWGWLGLFLGLVGISGIGLGDDLLTLLHQPSAWQGIPWGQWWQRGELWMLLAALSMAVGTILMRPLARYADPVVATGWHMVLGGLPLLLLPSLNTPAPWAALQWPDVFNLGYATLFGSALSYGVFFYFAAKGNLTSLSALTFLTPVFALTFGHWFLGETLSQVQLLGVGLTLVSIYIINQRQVLGRWWQQLPLPTRLRESATSVSVKVVDQK